MKLPVDAQNVKDFAYTNGDLLTEKPKALVLSFHGLNGCTDLIRQHDGFARRCAEKNILFVVPYDHPWSWMNDQAVRLVDAIITALLEKHGVSSLPIISAGGSMGGLSAFIYTRYSAHPIAACAANCPVCDLPYHYTERPDLPRTIVAALSHYEMDLADAMESISPLHQVEKLPFIPYLIAHCEADQAVNLQMHGQRMAEALEKAGRQVTFLTVPGRGHCDLSPEVWETYQQFIFQHCED